MITLDLALLLRTAGLAWEPSSGDRFAIAARSFEGEVFVVSEMTIEATQIRGQHVLRFNGTTEWALDSLEADEAVWLPREDQLRARIGPAFRALRVLPDGYEVQLADGSHGVTSVRSPDAECAYARALLSVLTPGAEAGDSSDR